ncbi:hypothetical protein HUG39_005048 [Salmonella enterica]|nr:hypothetical protein [Salmonella enterica]
MVSREIRKMPECERIIYQTNLKLPEIRRELYTEKRDWFDIDGRLYALNENGSVIDIHGYESDCYGMSVLPDGVTVNDMLIAKNKYIAENGDYD